MKAVDKKKQISVLIPDGWSYEALKVIRCLGQVPEFTIHLLINSRRALARHSRYCDKYHIHNINNMDEASIVEIIKNIAEQNNTDLVLPASPSYSELVSRNRASISETAAVPVLPTEDAFRIALDKWLFYKFCQEKGFPVIPSILAIDSREISTDKDSLDSIEYPALLKPVLGMGGRGIIKINNPADLYRIVENKEMLNGDDKYLLQSYTPGRDFCLGVCCKDGKIIASALQKSLFERDNFFGPQKAIEYIHDDKIIELGEQIVSELGWEGVAFIDFRFDKRDNNLKLLEVNPRFGRGLLGALQAGINFPFIWCLSSLSMEYTGKREADGKYVYPSFFFSILKSRLFGKSIPIKASVRETGLGLLLGDPVPDILNSIFKLKRKYSNLRKNNAGKNHKN